MSGSLFAALQKRETPFWFVYSIWPRFPRWPWRRNFQVKAKTQKDPVEGEGRWQKEKNLYYDHDNKHENDSKQKAGWSKNKIERREKIQQRLRDCKLKSKVLTLNAPTRKWRQKRRERMSSSFVRTSSAINRRCMTSSLNIWLDIIAFWRVGFGLINCCPRFHF